VVATALLPAIGVRADPAPGDGQVFEIVRVEEREISPVLPDPVSPEVSTPAPGIQLLGFAMESVKGNQGILNYTLACQRAFPSSRMCTAGEVMRTVHVPPVPMVQFAWVQPDGACEISSEFNCSGWTSASQKHTGTVLELQACFGGLMRVSCNSSLAIACCGELPQE